MNRSTRAALVGLTALLMVVPITAALAYPTTAGTFTDDDGNIHEANIEAIAADGITKGCNPPANDRFCPSQGVTRGQMAAFLRRAFGLAKTSNDHFVDDEDSIFEADINALAEAGITKGCNPPANDRFCPDRIVSRGQMAAFLKRAFGYGAASTDYFVDDNSSIFEADINSIRKAGVTKGCNPPDNTRYCPGDQVNRDQMGSFLSRAKGLSAKDPTPLGGSSCDPAYHPCVPPVSEVGDLNCPDIRAEYPNGVKNDLANYGDPHRLNADKDGEACESTA